MSQLTQDYTDMIRDVGCLLDGNSEWIPRYKGYVSAINCKSSIIKQASLRFGSTPNLDIYLPTSKAKQANRSTVFFDVRYKGQSVAELRIRAAGVFIKFLTTNEKYYSAYPPTLSISSENGEKGWQSQEARLFRKFFAGSPSRKKGENREHDFESQLLKQFSKKTSNGKYLRNIQPIRLLGKNFQMPTPITASRAMDGAMDYSKHNGGGIDILVRQGIGNDVCLTVIELKDECVAHEPPERAIMQAIAYATFLQKLLRTPDADSNGWWSFFGFNGPIPAKLKIRTVIAMPRGDYNNTSFAMEKLDIPNSSDCLELHNLYFNADGNITGIADTSLMG